MGKTRKELLEKYYEQEMNRVFMSSNNYLMTSPKKGREDDFFDAWACANMLKEMMDEEAGKEMG